MGLVRARDWSPFFARFVSLWWSGVRESEVAARDYFSKLDALRRSQIASLETEELPEALAELESKHQTFVHTYEVAKKEAEDAAHRTPEQEKAFQAALLAAEAERRAKEEKERAAEEARRRAAEEQERRKAEARAAEEALVKAAEEYERRRAEELCRRETEETVRLMREEEEEEKKRARKLEEKDVRRKVEKASRRKEGVTRPQGPADSEARRLGRLSLDPGPFEDGQGLEGPYAGEDASPSFIANVQELEESYMESRRRGNNHVNARDDAIGIWEMNHNEDWEDEGVDWVSFDSSLVCCPSC